MQAARPVLIVEDDHGVATTIRTALSRDGWQTITASTLAEGRVRLREDQPCIAVIDLGLPDGNGITFVREVAAQGRFGIIVVSGRGEEMDRVIGLEVGADDYLAKPFSSREMVARVRALSRRLEAVSSAAVAPVSATLEMPQTWSFGGVNLEPSRHRLVDAEGVETRLTGGEAGLLYLLLNQCDYLADRQTISEKVLGRRLLPEQRGVDQLASSLRRKLHDASGERITLTAVRGRGYRLVC